MYIYLSGSVSPPSSKERTLIQLIRKEREGVSAKHCFWGRKKSWGINNLLTLRLLAADKESELGVRVWGDRWVCDPD